MNIFDYFLGNYDHKEDEPESFTGNYDTFTVVGDDDQSIYGFRGSYSKFFTEFEKRYGAKEVTLETNYRSGKEIVDLKIRW
jgi:superfamily I DNA/RNA helicase